MGGRRISPLGTPDPVRAGGLIRKALGGVTVSSFAGWLKSIQVLYVGDPHLPQLGWLSAAGARVIRAQTSEEARAIALEDPSVVDVAVLDAEWPQVGFVGVVRDLPPSCTPIVISSRNEV